MIMRYNVFILVVFPSAAIAASPRTIFAEFGTTAVLDCSLSPGRLVRQYFVTWQNGSNGREYAGIQRPRLTQFQPTQTSSVSRYSVQPSTLALVISNVDLSDSDTTYRCVVGVEDPEDDSTAMIFDDTTTTDINLIVYSK